MQECKIINEKYNTEFTNSLYENEHIFNEIYDACNNKFQRGCGSYLFDGQTYRYSDRMYGKQELLFNSVKNVNSALEIGTYMGHSILIMLLSNPDLRVTCIDINDTYTGPSVNVLNKHFNNRVTFLHGSSLDVMPNLKAEYDFFHVDGQHENSFIHKEFDLIKKLNKDKSLLRVMFDDQVCMVPLQNHIRQNYNVEKEVMPKCDWNNIYFEIKL